MFKQKFCELVMNSSLMILTKVLLFSRNKTKKSFFLTKLQKSNKQYLLIYPKAQIETSSKAAKGNGQQTCKVLSSVNWKLKSSSNKTISTQMIKCRKFSNFKTINHQNKSQNRKQKITFRVKVKSTSYLTIINLCRKYAAAPISKWINSNENSYS